MGRPRSRSRPPARCDILEAVALKKAIDESEAKVPLVKCTVCESACTPMSYVHPGTDDNLCWVCRRLKISAWRDSDVQPQPNQE